MTINAHLIPLFGKIYYIPRSNDKESLVDPRHVELFNVELAACGYSLSPSALEGLKKASKIDFHVARKDVLKVVREFSTIPNVNVLFKKFPYDIPDDFDYFVRRVVGNLQRFLPRKKNGVLLSCGHFIDPNLFDLQEFGACPVCQHQVDELDGDPVARNAYSNVSPLKFLDLIDESGVENLASNLLARPSSLSGQEKEFLRFAMSNFSVKLPEKCFKETLPFVYESTDDMDYVRSQISGATDVLRLAYFVSNPDADLSLKENVKFKLKAKHVRDFLSLLDGLPNLVEDLMRDRERWLRFGELAHPNSAKNQKRYPAVALAFDTLRNYPHSVETFNRKVHRATTDKNVAAMVDILSSRPGEFARRLDNMVSIAENSPPPNNYRFKEIIKAFSNVVTKVPTKILFEIVSHFQYRSGFVSDENRLFFIKGSQNTIYFTPEKRGKIPADKADEIIKIAKGELVLRSYQENLGRNELGKVYIDPALNGMVVPFNRRGDSNKSENILLKGSRLPFHGSVLRLFVWWKGHIDVDLSANFYDENWEYVEHVAYTHLATKGGYAVHSGDIQDAPDGATEFIDIDVEKCRRMVHHARYLVTSIISFRGESFDSFPCYAGFMERDKLGGGGKLFEPTSVATKFEVSQKATRLMTFAFDLVTKEVILLDMVVGGGRFHNAARSTDKFRTVAKHIVSLPEKKPTFFNVLEVYATANGKIVQNREEADTVFDMETVNLELIDGLLK